QRLWAHAGKGRRSGRPMQEFPTSEARHGYLPGRGCAEPLLCMDGGGQHRGATKHFGDAIGARTHTRSSTGTVLNKFQARKEIANLECRRLWRVRSVRAVR